MQVLQISEADLISGAYADLLIDLEAERTVWERLKTHFAIVTRGKRQRHERCNSTFRSIFFVDVPSNPHFQTNWLNFLPFFRKLSTKIANYT